MNKYYQEDYDITIDTTRQLLLQKNVLHPMHSSAIYDRLSLLNIRRKYQEDSPINIHVRSIAYNKDYVFNFLFHLHPLGRFSGNAPGYATEYLETYKPQNKVRNRINTMKRVMLAQDSYKFDKLCSEVFDDIKPIKKSKFASLKIPVLNYLLSFLTTPIDLHRNYFGLFWDGLDPVPTNNYYAPDIRSQLGDTDCHLSLNQSDVLTDP